MCFCQVLLPSNLSGWKKEVTLESLGFFGDLNFLGDFKRSLGVFTAPLYKVTGNIYGLSNAPRTWGLHVIRTLLADFFGSF